MDAKGHWHEEEGPEEEVYECAVCPYIYNELYDCKNHEIVDHYYCSDCKRSFMNYNNIKLVCPMRPLPSPLII